LAGGGARAVALRSASAEHQQRPIFSIRSVWLGGIQQSHQD